MRLDFFFFFFFFCISSPGWKKIYLQHYFLKEAANQSTVKRDSPKVGKYIKKSLYMNP